MSEVDVQRFLDAVVAASGGRLSPLRAVSDLPALVAASSIAGYGIDSVAVNGRRVDVTVVAPDRELAVVLNVEGREVDSVVAFERPPFFAGVDGGRAVIVNGPSSSGKSTVMSAVLARSDTPWVMFDELFFGTVEMPYLIWGDQAPTLRPGFVAGITALAAAGNEVILTGGDSTEFDELRARVPTLAVGLDCPLEVRLERQAARSDRWGGLTEATENRHAGWTYDLRFDTSAIGADDIAAQILHAVAEL